jgi:hypothetical protein
VVVSLFVLLVVAIELHRCSRSRALVHVIILPKKRSFTFPQRVFISTTCYNDIGMFLYIGHSLIFPQLVPDEMSDPSGATDLSATPPVRSSLSSAVSRQCFL